jgi:hypothetical protein
MTKRQFLHDYVIRRCPKTAEETRLAVLEGEKVWEELNALGLGASEPTGPRERANHYAALDARQKADFDRFWHEYNHKHGRNDAAGVWRMIEPDRDTVERILAAARAEAQRWRDNPPQGQTRIYAQGWLSARRWEDHIPEALAAGGPATAAPDPAAARQKALAEVQHWAGLYKVRPHDQAIQAQLDKAKQALAQLQSPLPQGEG